MNARKSLWNLVALSGLAMLLLAGCAARETVHPTHSYIIPDYAQKAVGIIALMPVVDHSGSGEVVPTVLSLLEERASNKTEYVFFSEEEVLGRIQKKGSTDQYNALLSAWRNEGKIETGHAVTVGKDVVADALLFTEVLFWNKEWVAPNTEGTSQSQVKIRTVLVSAKSGETLWEATDEQVMKSRYYSPESGIGTHVDSGGMVRASPLGGVPDPPPIEEVARRVLDAIFTTFP